MSDLVDALAAEAQRQRPDAAPPFDRLVARRRRRDRLRQGSAGAAAVVAVLAVVGGASLLTRDMDGSGQVARPDVPERSLLTGLTPNTGQVCDELGCVALSEQSAQVVARAVNASVAGDEATEACVRAEPAPTARLELGYAASPTGTFPVVVDCQAVIGPAGEPRQVSRRLVEDVRQLLSRTPPTGRRPLAPELAFSAYPGGGGMGTRLEGDDVQVVVQVPGNSPSLGVLFMGDGSARRVCGVTYEIRAPGEGETVVRVLERGFELDRAEWFVVLPWDGTDESGEQVPPGRYPLVAVADVVDGECGSAQTWQETYALNVVFVVE